MSTTDEIKDYLSGKQILGTIMLSPEISCSLSERLKREKKAASKLISQRKELAGQLGERRRVIATLQNLLSPIRRLPPEVLTEVFLQYIEIRKIGQWVGCWSAKTNLLYHVIPPILLLSQVCSSWRQIILAMPCLWSHIQFVVRTRHPTTQLFNEWLGRSASLPLDISIKVFHRLGDSFLLDSLLPVCSRWRSLEFYTIFSDMKPLLQNEPLTLPLLEQITLATHGITRHERLSVFANATKLTRVDLFTAGPLSGVWFDVGFPSGQITQLNLGKVSNDLSDLYHLIRDCTLLQSLNVKLDDFPSGVAATSITGTIHLAHLRVLLVEFTGTLGFPEFFDAFKLPVLKKLSLKHPYDLDEMESDLDDLEDFDDDFDIFGPFGKLFGRNSPTTALVNLQKRSQFELTSLELNGITSMKWHGLSKFLRVVPSLQNLSLEGCHLDVASLCEGLTVRGPSESMTEEGKTKSNTDTKASDLLVPNLTKIRLVQDNELEERMRDIELELDFSGGVRAMMHKYENTISRMVKSRWDPYHFDLSYFGRSEAGPRPEEWLDSWSVARLVGGLEVSRGILNPWDDDMDLIGYYGGEDEEGELEELSRQGMPLQIL
ncbi:hypothetical protein VKT23_009228 [Stygiomarasmius scandens]|uniref:F-box domain-containing protein n=1 Tax=Marasmiellus scandens TaxID=2682957 RepID=A0ABR1JHI8_9AGAR